MATYDAKRATGGQGHVPAERMASHGPRTQPPEFVDHDPDPETTMAQTGPPDASRDLVPAAIESHTTYDSIKMLPDVWARRHPRSAGTYHFRTAIAQASHLCHGPCHSCGANSR